MPMARTRRGRLKQVEAWLRLNYPPPMPTCVRVIKVLKGSPAECYGLGDRKVTEIVVNLRSNMTWYIAIDTLLHEWGHVVAWHQETIEHNRAWSDAYGRIYQHWYDLGGAEDSREL